MSGACGRVMSLPDGVARVDQGLGALGKGEVLVLEGDTPLREVRMDTRS